MPKQSATKAAKRSASQALASAEKAIEAARKATKKAKKADANAKNAQASALRAAQLERSSSDRKATHAAGKQAATEEGITKKTAQAPRKTASAHGRSLGPPRKKAGNRKSGKKAAEKKPVSRSAVKRPGAKRSVRRERRGS